MSAVSVSDGSNFEGIEFARANPAVLIPWTDESSAVSLNIAVVDTGETTGDTFLLLHGEPSWSALYSEWIPELIADGHRCVAVDLPGFGRSDKPLVESWYTYERHCAALRHVIESLDLERMSIVVQDWAGPIGLRQLVDMPGRFVRAFVFNTWLHHPGYVYSEGIERWQAMATDPEVFGTLMPAGRIVAGSMRREHDAAEVARVFDAPFETLESRAGARAFPKMIPFDGNERGGASQQHRCHDALIRGLGIPVHFAFGDADPVFTAEQGRAWATSVPESTFDVIPGAGHFVQFDAAQDCLAVVRRHVPRTRP